MLRNVAQPDRPQMAVWPLRISRWIPKATDTQSLYMKYLLLQQWLYERASMLRYPYIACRVVCSLLDNFAAPEFYMPTFRNTLFHLHKQVGMKYFIPTCLWKWNRQCYETSAYKIQTPGNYPEDSIRHAEQGESLKSRIACLVYF